MAVERSIISCIIVVFVVSAVLSFSAAAVPQVYELKYVVTHVPGNLAEPQVFAGNECSQRFRRLGLEEGAVRLELDLVPRDLGSYRLEGGEVRVTPGKGAQPLWACVTADRVTVEVRVVGESGGDVLVEYTVAFANFRAVAMLPEGLRGKYLGYYEAVLGSPSYVKEGTAVWVSKDFRITRLVAVKGDGEAFDVEEGVWLGEWVFWRKPWTGSAEPRLILAGVNYGMPYLSGGGPGYTAFLAYVGGEASGEGYELRLNGKAFAVGAGDVVVGYTVPLPFVSASVPRSPSPQVERLLGVFGCTVKKGVKVEILCDKLLNAYEKSGGEKPWRLVVRSRAYGGSTWGFAEILYRGLTLAPHPMDVYRLAYWKDTGVLLYMGEDGELAGTVYGYAPPPLSGYIHIDHMAVAFTGLGSPLALSLVEARVSAPPAASTAAAGHGHALVAALAAAVAMAPLAIAARWAARHRS